MQEKLKKGDMAIVNKNFWFAERLGLVKGDIIVIKGVLNCKYQDCNEYPCNEVCLGKIKFSKPGSKTAQVSCMCNGNGSAIEKYKARRKKCE